MFADQMVRGPFKQWLHRHVVTPQGPDTSVLADDIEFELPLGILGRIVGGPIAYRQTRAPVRVPTRGDATGVRDRSAGHDQSRGIAG